MKSAFISFLLLCLIIFSGYTQIPKAQWLAEDRFGMFIHWGLYSAAEGIWKGERLRHPNNYAEWIRYRNRIGSEEYAALAKRFDWESIDPEDWVLLAKKAGMKYIVITAKHHDGIAIWDSQVDSFTLPKLSGSKRDVIKEIAEACKKHHIKLCFYYSHWIDWQHPYGWNHNQELVGKVTNEQYNHYWQEKVIPQVRELLSNYGEIAMMWFDMWIPYQQSIVQKEQLIQLAELIHDLQPKCIINSRLGLPVESEYVDFETLGDNEFGSAYTEHIWETPGTIAHSWGYNALENEWKSTNQIFQSLINNASLNGSYTLNVGPRANGEVPYEGVERLTTVGNWLSQYGQSIYHTTGLELRSSQHDWGRLTVNRKEKTIYLHVYNWPLDGILRVTGLKNKPKKVELMNGSSFTGLTSHQYGPLLSIQCPKDPADPYVSVVKLTMDDIAIDKDVVGEASFGGFSLNAKNTLSDSIHFLGFDGTKPDRLVLKANEQLNWKLFLPKAGTYKICASVYNGSGKEVELSLKIGGINRKVVSKPNGKITVEPNQNWYVEEFLDVDFEPIHMNNPQELAVSFKANEGIQFHRIWIELQQK